MSANLMLLMTKINVLQCQCCIYKQQQQSDTSAVF